MKITVKPKQEEKCQDVPFDKIPVGYVYEVYDGVVLLKVTSTNAVIFAGVGGCNYLGMADGYKAHSATKILGKLTEIIVQEE